MRFAVLLVLLGLVVAGCRPAPPPVEATWTLMFYTDADNDLEEPALNDLRQLLKVGSNEQVQLVMLCDRNESDSSLDGYSNERVFNLDPWEDAKLLHLGQEKIEVLEPWGEANMADPATLERFIATASELYPAKHYALFIGDHGAGWEGVCTDESAEDDILTLPELDRALAKSGLNFELIGFDACFMGGLETALTVAPYAKVMVASEEVEPVLGWDYESLARGLREKPDLDTLAISRLLVSTYVTSFERSGNATVAAEGQTITLSVIDLQAMQKVRKAFDKLAALFKENLGSEDRITWLSFAKSRRAAEEYGEDGDEAGMEMFDLLGFVKALQEYSNHTPTKEAAAELQSALQSAILENVRGEALPGSHGLSLYLPSDDTSLEEYSALPIWTDSPWPEAIKSFLSLTGSPNSGQVADLEASDEVVLGHQPITVTASLSEPDEAQEVYFVLAQRKGRDALVIGLERMEPTESLEKTWNGQWWMTEEGVLLPKRGPSLEQFRVESKQGKLSLHVHHDQVVRITEVGSGGVRHVKMDLEGELHPIDVSVDEHGQRTKVVRDEFLTTKDLKFSKEPVETGDYEIGFLAVGFDGRWDLELVPVRYGLE